MKSIDSQKIKSTFIKTNTVQQAGFACLASVIKFYGGDAEKKKWLKNSGANVSGISLLGLCKAARTEGFDANGYRGSIDFLMEQEKPVILHVEKDSGNEDFIVVYGWQSNKFVIGDPQWGIVEYRKEELDAIWKSKALLLLEPDKTFQSAKNKRKAKKEWLLKLSKNQEKNLIINGLVGAVFAIVFIIFFLLMVNGVEQLVVVKSIKDIGIKALLLFFFVLVFIAIVQLKNSIATLGIKSYIKEFVNHLAESIFVPPPDREKKSEGIINSMLNAGQQFSSITIKIASGSLFYGILLITAFVSVSLSLVWAGVFIFVSSVVLIGTIWLRRKKISQFFVSAYQAEIKKAHTLPNNFEFYKNILLTNSEKTFSSATGKALNFYVDTREKLRSERNKFIVWYAIVTALMLLVVISMFLLRKGSNNQMDGYYLIGWSIVCFWSLNRLVNMLVDFFHLKVLSDFIYDFLGKELPKSEENLNELSKPLVQPITNVSVNNLSFSFPGKLPVFQNISFNAEKGKITVIYGKSGSGKSTMISVLNRMLPLEIGDIIFDGKSWLSFNNPQWREISSTIMQPVQLFNLSIIYNIGWGEKTLDQEKIIAFCKRTGFDKFFAKLSDGYSTNCNNISVGQKQMVALAAAIYRNPEILFLDEPLASMDDEMKEFCWQLLQQLKSEMVIMMFTGNREIAKMADKTFSLEQEDS